MLFLKSHTKAPRHCMLRFISGSESNTKVEDLRGVDKKNNVYSDGAATMVSAGKKLGIIHQLCLTHGVHLAVMDVIYNRQV